MLLNQVGLSGQSMQTWERIHSLHSPGTHQWQESITPESKQTCGGAAIDCKCETTDLPAMETPRHIIAHLGIYADCTHKVLLNDEYPFPENAHLVRTDSKHCICKKRDVICRPEGFIVFLNLVEICVCTLNLRWNSYLCIPQRIGPLLSLCYVKSNGYTVLFCPCLCEVLKVQLGTHCAPTWTH